MADREDNERLGVTIRPARPEDRAKVLGFCVDTFSWGDYIQEAWDAWLADPDGSLLVAEYDGLPVAIQHTSFPSADEAYLQGLRVDPAVRGRGVATAIFRAGLQMARERGARVVRLMTKVDNAAVHHMMEAAAFRLVVGLTDLRGPAAAELAVAPEAAVPGDIEDLWHLLEASEAFQAAGRLYIRQWCSLELTADRLAEHITAGDVFIIRRAGKPAALALVEWRNGGESLWADSFYGEPSALAELARQLRVLAARVEAPEVLAYVPHLDQVIQPLVAAGYVSEGRDHIPEMHLFAKDL